MHKFILTFLLGCLPSSFLLAQNAGEIKYLNAEQLIAVVKMYHPVVKQAALDTQFAAAEIIKAKGAFDPIISHNSSRKIVAGTDYYNYMNPSIVIPTWYGIELNAGVERLVGERFDPSETVGGTNYAGISVPLLKNLLLDKRRASLQQARIFRSSALVERQAAINDVLLDAMNQYWQWVGAYQLYKIANDNVAVNKQRIDLVRKAYQFGERAAIDTTEAIVQLQNFEYIRNENWIAFQNASIGLSAFLWLPNNQPYQLPENIFPEAAWEQEAIMRSLNQTETDLVATAMRMHPELTVYKYKLEALDIERRLKYQDLLPKLDLKYNQLAKGYNVLDRALPSLNNNAQYGVNFQMPLFFRTARGNYRQAKIKLESVDLDLQQKRISIENKVRTYARQLELYKEQIELLQATNKNYQRLLTAEETKLFNGESSLFLLNSREQKAIEGLQKLVELKVKYYKTIYALQWSMGILQ
jgi:outer membrane protein TolC